MNFPLIYVVVSQHIVVVLMLATPEYYGVLLLLFVATSTASCRFYSSCIAHRRTVAERPFISLAHHGLNDLITESVAEQ